MRSVISYEVFARMMERWTPEDQFRLQAAKKRHVAESCAFVEAVTRATANDLDPELVRIARNMRTVDPADMNLYTCKGPRGSAVQALYINGIRRGTSYEATDEVSGEISTEEGL